MKRCSTLLGVHNLFTWGNIFSIVLSCAVTPSRMSLSQPLLPNRVPASYFMHNQRSTEAFYRQEQFFPINKSPRMFSNEVPNPLVSQETHWVGCNWHRFKRWPRKNQPQQMFAILAFLSPWNRDIQKGTHVPSPHFSTSTHKKTTLLLSFQEREHSYPHLQPICRLPHSWPKEEASRC